MTFHMQIPDNGPDSQKSKTPITSQVVGEVSVIGPSFYNQIIIEIQLTKELRNVCTGGRYPIFTNLIRFIT